MGASKKLMEEMIMAYAGRLPVTTARFANVAFSNGSLPLGFIERLGKRQPWSSPLGVRRFFVSPQESGELCLIASVMGESGDIFFPRLDEERDMISFDAIARDLLNFLGMESDACNTEEEAKAKMEIKVKAKMAVRVAASDKASRIDETPEKYPVYFFETDTSGEKPYEEFFTEKEVIDSDRFINLGVIKNSVRRNTGEIDEIFEKLRHLFASDSVTKAAIVDILKRWLPNFEHIEKGKGLDSKM
jgi:FlaA1/EpsC-like NDP-sugar epimerase